MTGNTESLSLPLVSIIVPVWNAGSYLDACVGSLCSQNYPKLDIILVDDGSTDGSSECCDDAAKRDQRVRVIHQTCKGVSAARNAGLDAAAGEYVLFVDSDDQLRVDAVMGAMRCARDYSADMVVCGYDVVEVLADGSTVSRGGKSVRQEEVLDTNQRHEKNMADRICALDNDELLYQCWGKLYRRAAIGDLRFARDVMFGEDTVFVLDLLARGIRMVCSPQRSYLYLQHANSLARGFRPGKAHDLEYSHGRHLAFYQGMPISGANKSGLHLRLANDVLWTVFDAGKTAGSADKAELLRFVRCIASSPYRGVYLKELRRVATDRRTKVAFAVNMTFSWKWYLR